MQTNSVSFLKEDVVVDKAEVVVELGYVAGEDPVALASRGPALLLVAALMQKLSCCQSRTRALRPKEREG